MSDIASQCNHDTKYVLEATGGTLGKVSNNPAEQNHANIVHWVGTKLYEEPGYEIKQLLGRQSELKKKHNKEKRYYYFQIQFEITVHPHFTADNELGRANELLDKKYVVLWHEEKVLSVNDIIAVNESNGDRSFTHRNAPLSQHMVPHGNRCNCPSE